MPAQNPTKPPIPRWAWIFAAACIVIPVSTLGGLIPSAIGVFSGLGVLGIARQSGKPTRRKVILCSVVTGSAWTVFTVFLIALTALQAQHPQLKPARNKAVSSRQSPRENAGSQVPTVGYTATAAGSEAPEAGFTLKDRQKIYRQATSMRYHIEAAREQRARSKAKGFDVSSRDEMIETLKRREQDKFEFVMNFHDIDREKLDEIIREGDGNNWPTR